MNFSFDEWTKKFDYKKAIDEFKNKNDKELLKIAKENGNCVPIANQFKKEFKQGKVWILNEFMRENNIDMLKEKINNQFNTRGHALFEVDNKIYDPVLFVRNNLPIVTMTKENYIQLIKEPEIQKEFKKLSYEEWFAENCPECYMCKEQLIEQIENQVYYEEYEKYLLEDFE